MVNPNKYIRIAYRTAFQVLTVPSWSKKVPKGTTVPDTYVLLHSQTKSTTERSKDGFEWLCTIVFDIISRQEAGYADTEPLDDIEEDIVDIVESDIHIASFTVKDINMVSSIDLDAEQNDEISIIRRVLTYQFWLSNEDVA